jgi:hypothetical protein
MVKHSHEDATIERREDQWIPFTGGLGTTPQSNSEKLLCEISPLDYGTRNVSPWDIESTYFPHKVHEHGSHLRCHDGSNQVGKG